jgi:hypothetical protein
MAVAWQVGALPRKRMASRISRWIILVAASCQWEKGKRW